MPTIDYDTAPTAAPQVEGPAAEPTTDAPEEPLD